MRAATAGSAAHEAEELTWDKSDPKDAVLIALDAERRCYEPERIEATWARLRHWCLAGGG